MRILAETRNRKHSKELFKLLREAYDDVQILGYYDSPEDYVAGNLQSSKFESVEDENPFEGNMNIQYNQDLDQDQDLEDIHEVDSEISHEDLSDSIDNLKITTKLAEKTSKASSRLN